MTEKEITSIVKGAVQIKYEDGYAFPLRFTDYQLERYKGIPRCIFAYATAGIELDFMTDADEISFLYRTKEVWNWWKDSHPCFDIYENGEFSEFVQTELANSEGRVVYHCHSGGKRKRITIYFPCNAEVLFKVVNLGNVEPTPERKRKFLILGDSISQGLMGNSASFNYASQIKRFYDADMLNLSVGGDCYDETALDPDINFKPTDIIVALGTNDVYFFKIHELITENMNKYLDRVKKLYGYSDITVISPPWITDSNAGAAEQYKENVRFSAEIANKCRVMGFRYVSGESLIPHNERFFSDTAHPNDLGFSLYAINLIKALL